MTNEDSLSTYLSKTPVVWLLVGKTLRGFFASFCDLFSRGQLKAEVFKHRFRILNELLKTIRKEIAGVPYEITGKLLRTTPYVRLSSRPSFGQHNYWKIVVKKLHTIKFVQIICLFVLYTIFWNSPWKCKRLLRRLLYIRSIHHLARQAVAVIRRGNRWITPLGIWFF